MALENVEALLAEGFDCVAMARALLHDPGLVAKFRSGAVTRYRVYALQCVRVQYLWCGRDELR
ncbi:MAG: hypothetical protein WDN04_08135 [Rhodospirillales bacterium]